jgi:hypothetical protein
MARGPNQKCLYGDMCRELVRLRNADDQVATLKSYMYCRSKLNGRFMLWIAETDERFENAFLFMEKINKRLVIVLAVGFARYYGSAKLHSDWGRLRFRKSSVLQSVVLLLEESAETMPELALFQANHNDWTKRQYYGNLAVFNKHLRTTMDHPQGERLRTIGLDLVKHDARLGSLYGIPTKELVGKPNYHIYTATQHFMKQHDFYTTCCLVAPQLQMKLPEVLFRHVLRFLFDTVDELPHANAIGAVHISSPCGMLALPLPKTPLVLKLGKRKRSDKK